MGGSESRFVVHHSRADPSDTPCDDAYLTQLPDKQRVGEAVEYASRAVDNQYQRVVVKTVGKCAALRYDMHPQHCIGVDEDRVAMLSNLLVESVQWKILIFAQRPSTETEWCELAAADCNLGYDACKGKSLLVALYHPESKAFLEYCHGADSPRLLPVPPAYRDGDMALEDRAAFAQALLGCCWTLECVGTNSGASDLIGASAVARIEVGPSPLAAGVPLPKKGYYPLFEASPAVVVYAGDKMVKHGKGVAADRLENFCFDAGKCGLL